MTTPYSITITMDQNTVVALQSGGFALYGFKGVQTTLQGGAPLVWIQSRQFSLETQISWTEKYQAYTSKNEIIPNGQILASAAYNIDLNQTLDVTSPAGTGQVVTGGTKNAISIRNQTTTQFTSGISQVNSSTNTATPLCAFPLYGLGLDVIAPIQLVMLEFATAAVNTGTVIFQAFSQAALVDLTTESQVPVSFNINQGWAAGGNPNVKFFPPGTNIAPLLLRA